MEDCEFCEQPVEVRLTPGGRQVWETRRDQQALGTVLYLCPGAPGERHVPGSAS
jgi:hypothetical protein